MLKPENLFLRQWVSNGVLFTAGWHTLLSPHACSVQSWLVSSSKLSLQWTHLKQPQITFHLSYFLNFYPLKDSWEFKKKQLPTLAAFQFAVPVSHHNYISICLCASCLPPSFCFLAKKYGFAPLHSHCSVLSCWTSKAMRPIVHWIKSQKFWDRISISFWKLITLGIYFVLLMLLTI